MSNLSVSQKSQLVGVFLRELAHVDWHKRSSVELDAFVKHLLRSKHVAQVDVRNSTLKVDHWVVVAMQAKRFL